MAVDSDANALLNIKRKFRVPPCDKTTSEWESWFILFELQCCSQGLGTGPNANKVRRDPILAAVGCEYLPAIRVHFTPDVPTSRFYDEITAPFCQMFRPALTVFSARAAFHSASRATSYGESVHAYASRLRLLRALPPWLRSPDRKRA